MLEKLYVYIKRKGAKYVQKPTAYIMLKTLPRDISKEKNLLFLSKDDLQNQTIEMNCFFLRRYMKELVIFLHGGVGIFVFELLA